MISQFSRRLLLSRRHPLVFKKRCERRTCFLFLRAQFSKKKKKKKRGGISADLQTEAPEREDAKRTMKATAKIEVLAPDFCRKKGKCLGEKEEKCLGQKRKRERKKEREREKKEKICSTQSVGEFLAKCLP